MACRPSIRSATSTRASSATAWRKALGSHRAVLLKMHGAAIVGASVEEAFVAALQLEENAEKQLWAEATGKVEAMTAEEAARSVRQSFQPSSIQKRWQYYQDLERVARRLRADDMPKMTRHRAVDAGPRRAGHREPHPRARRRGRCVRPRQHPPPGASRIATSCRARARPSASRSTTSWSSRSTARRSTPAGRKPYAERFIHGAVYEARPEVQRRRPQPQPQRDSVRHHRHAAAAGDAHVRVDGRATCRSGIRARSSATRICWSRTWRWRATWPRRSAAVPVALMRGHGCVVAGRSLREVVFNAVYLRAERRPAAEGGGARARSPSSATARSRPSCARAGRSPSSAPGSTGAGAPAAPYDVPADGGSASDRTPIRLLDDDRWTLTFSSSAPGRSG